MLRYEVREGVFLNSDNTASDRKLGTENIWRLIFSMGIPTLVAQVINVLYNIVDRIYIGHIEGIGATALTGVGLTMPIIVIISAFSSFIGGGGPPLAAIALGKGDREKAEKILSNGVTVLICLSIVLSVVFFIIKKPFLYLIGASDATFPYADEYLSIYLLGTVFVQITVGLNTFITAQGRSNIAMLSVLIGAVMNIILDPIFIFVFGLNVKGAAIATVISQAFSAAWVLRFLTSKKADLRIKKKFLKPQAAVVKSVAALGISPFVMQSTESLISIVMNSGLQKYGGDLYVGSLTIMQSVMQIMTTPVSGFAQGIAPIISYNYGAGNTDRVKTTFRRLAALMFGYTSLIALAAILFPQIFAGMFTSDAELIRLTSRILPIFVCGMLIFGLQMACQNTFMALGQAKISLFIAMLRKVILLIPLSLILPRFFGVMGVYYAEPVSDITAAVTCVILFSLNFKKILSHQR